MRFKEIPEDVILDDMYLSLNILCTKHIIFLKNCQIYDDSLDSTYNYKRTQRYLAGYFQILRDKELLSRLSRKQKIMLFWHKYIRISIPLLLLCCYGLIGIRSFGHLNYFIAFICISYLILIFVLPNNFRFCQQIKCLIRFVTFYSFATIVLFFSQFLLNMKIKNGKL